MKKVRFITGFELRAYFLDSSRKRDKKRNVQVFYKSVVNDILLSEPQPQLQLISYEEKKK